jgi:hypothetical protein
MTANLFRYPNEQWRRMEDIVQRAGGAGARTKFNAERASFEKMAGAWKGRIQRWDGRTLGYDYAGAYRRVEQAASELGAALRELNFPAIFIGCDLTWKPLAETQENEERLRHFLNAVEHVHARAAQMAEPKRKQIHLVRDRFFGELGRVWRVELGLPISASAASRFAQYVEVASEGVCKLPDKKARVTISGVIRKWPRRGVA